MFTFAPQAFIKRLLQVCSTMSTNFICGALILLSEVLQDKPHLLNLKALAAREKNQAEMSESEGEEEHFVDEDEEEDVKGLDHEKEVKAVLGEKGGKSTGQSSWVHRRLRQSELDLERLANNE